MEIVKVKKLKELFGKTKGLKPGFNYLAGGTDLVVAYKKGMQASDVWVDISALDDLKKIEEKKGSILIGSLVTYSGIMSSAVIKKWAPSLFSVCPQFALPAIRNSATLGGNCANASPAGDGIPALYAEGADVIIAGRGSKRKFPIEKIFTGPGRTILKKGELITGFEISKRPGAKGVFVKLAPRGGLGISKVSLALSAHFTEGKIDAVNIALGAVGPTVLRAVRAEQYLLGKSVGRDVINEAQKVILNDCSPITDFRSTAEYRKAMVAVLLKRALLKVANDGYR